MIGTLQQIYEDMEHGVYDFTKDEKCSSCGACCLGKGYVGADDDFFSGYEKGTESIMRIMDTVGQSDLLNLKGQYIRIAYKGIGNPVEIIGNIIQDKWFNYKSML